MLLAAITIYQFPLISIVLHNFSRLFKKVEPGIQNGDAQTQSPLFLQIVYPWSKSHPSDLHTLVLVLLTFKNIYILELPLFLH